jgi:hypothetical protein
MVSATGRKIGVTIMIKGAISIKVPRIKRLAIIIKRINAGELVIPRIKSDIIRGASSKASSQPNAAAEPICAMVVILLNYSERNWGQLKLRLELME